MKTLETVLFLASLVLQVAAVVFAVRMVSRSALRAPWYAMAAALSAMTAFRVVGLLSSGKDPHWLLAEGTFVTFSAVISPVISLLLFLSLFAIRRLSLVQQSSETARRVAEESLRHSDFRLRAIFNQTTGFMSILSPDGTLLDVNPAPLEASGFGRDDVIGKPFWEIGWFSPSPEMAAQLRTSIEEAARGQPARYESTYFMADGSARTVDRSITPIRDDAGRVVYVIAEARDITDRKRVEDDLVRAKQEAESASAAKDRFLAFLSHELRTPLTPVLLAVSELERAENVPAEIRGEMGMIRRNVELEARLIDDLLDLTRITRGKLQLHNEVTDVHVLIRGAHEICCTGGGPATEMRLEAARHHVRGDPARLQQVFWNLLNNARKFTPEDGRIQILTRDAGGNRLRVEIIDSGVGIEPELLPRVFHAFEQGVSTARRFGGLGLGLAICKALVELHGGRIEAHSDGKGQGSRFIVDLPLVAVAPAAPAPDGDGLPAEGVAGPLRILLVEDHAETALVMSKLLSGMGHDVRAAGTAGEAEQAWRAEPFDLLISDLGLPDATGHELMVRLKQHRPVRGIAVSGYGTAEDVQRSSEVGFASHVTKPLDLRRLKAAIEKACAP